MIYKKKLVLSFLLIAALLVVQLIFPHYLWMQAGYAKYVFRPYQSARNMLFGYVPFSLGDLLYFAGALVLIALFIRWFYFFIRFRTHKNYLVASLINTLNTFSIIYLLFFIGWGGNYYRQSLTKYWALGTADSNQKMSIATFDDFLIERLNDLAPNYTAVPFPQVNQRAIAYYNQLTDRQTRHTGLKAKPSIYGYFMQYLAIQGYYNPFTGEAQVNRFLPSYMLPFVVCHEMAHQSGIAAEDDANLMSYALCISSGDKDFSYSAYLNIWLYTHSRMRLEDTGAANQLLTKLNPVSQLQVDTLRAIRRRYRSNLSVVSMAMYDEYLKLHDQRGGVDSYYGVVMSAWKWELKRRQMKIETLAIP